MEVAGPVTTIYSPFAAKRSNMIVRPGGAQTRVKLGIVGDYLKRFTRAAQRARDRIYIDGLAGSGTGIDPRTGQLYDGSAKRCFDVEPPFTEVYLIEKDKARAAELQKIADEHEGAKAICGDVNVEIPKLLATLNPKAPTFAFLDAYCDGLQNRLGYEHVLHVAVAGDSGAPLYYLVFASDCPAGETIMRWEFGASHEEQSQLFNLGEYTPGISYDPDRTKNYRSAY